MRRSRNVITYHNRKGRPLVHTDAKGHEFIMVRAKGGGTKRLYEGSQYSEGMGGATKKRLKLS